MTVKVTDTARYFHIQGHGSLWKNSMRDREVSQNMEPETDSE